MGKTIAAISTLVLIASLAFGQITQMRTSYSSSVAADSMSATVTKVKWQKDAANPYKKILGFEISNDGGAGASIFYAFNDDTTDENRFILTNTSSQAESDKMEGILVNHIYVWSKSGSVAYRMKVW